MNVAPVTLEGNHVRLEPLSLEHLDALCAVGLDPELWNFTTVNIRNREDMRAYVEEALKLQVAGTVIAFATRDKKSAHIVGSTRLADIQTQHRTMEIGWTWIARSHQRTAVNTEAKYLMLRHAFETMDARRVMLKTDETNVKSRAAIARIGAKQEGILRNHMLVWGGRNRNSVIFSIIAEEWPEVKRNLEAKLAERASA
ncbi:MAG: GNAT family N-acetyltransferase [Terriglobales bacterium]|jgi:N-acetyltransferase